MLLLVVGRVFCLRFVVISMPERDPDQYSGAQCYAELKEGQAAVRRGSDETGPARRWACLWIPTSCARRSVRRWGTTLARNASAATKRRVSWRAIDLLSIRELPHPLGPMVKGVGRRSKTLIVASPRRATDAASSAPFKIMLLSKRPTRNRGSASCYVVSGSRRGGRNLATARPESKIAVAPWRVRCACRYAPVTRLRSRECPWLPVKSQILAHRDQVPYRPLMVPARKLKPTIAAPHAIVTTVVPASAP